jgi:hypothetical protein
VAEHLNRRTDRQHRCAPRGRLLKARVPDQVAGRESLRVILCPAKGVQVQLRGHRIRQRDLDDLCSDTAHPQPLSQDNRIAAVPIGSHDVRQH